MNVERYTLLLVEHDPTARAFLADNLTADAYEVVVVDNADDGLKEADRRMPDLAIVGVNDGSGRDFARLVRDKAASGDERLPMILLGTVQHEMEAIRALEAGADDYMAKPFSYPELRARVAALLRRVELESTRRTTSRVRRAGALTIDPDARSVVAGGMLLDQFSKKEFAFLWLLAENPNHVVPKRELIKLIWGRHGDTTSTRTIDSHACRVRNKLSVLGGQYIENVWGVGYRLMPITEQAAAA